jgi:hypothetical protein
LTNQEQLASEKRRKELIHQTYLTNKEKRRESYIDKHRKRIQHEQKGKKKKQTKTCKGGAGRRKLTNQEQLASEKRRKELKHQNYSTKNRKKRRLARVGLDVEC